MQSECESDGSGSSESEARMDDFLGNCEERWFAFEEIVQELTNKFIEHVGEKTSFDIALLFTKISVVETIEIISNHLISNCMYFEGFDSTHSSLNFYLFQL